MARAGAEQAGGGRPGTAIRTSHPAIARRALRLARSVWSSHPAIGVHRRGRRYEVSVPAEAASASLERRCCQWAFVRGLFLAAGSVNSPRAGHHLELVLRDAELADLVGQVLFAAGIPARVGARKDQVLVYLKDAGDIASFLGRVGAHQAMLRYEDARAMRDMKGQIQRLVNAETANLGKAVDAGLRQREVIAELKRTRRLERLPRPLREIALLRLAHPDASLAELGRLCRPPIGKSGVNHRLRRLMQLAETRS